MKPKWTRSLLEIFWPNRCPACNALIGPDKVVCEACGEHMLLEHDAVCRRCGKVGCICGKKELSYDRALAACAYAEETIPAIIRMKQSENTNFALFAARILAERLRHGIDFGEIDCVVPVPMHASKERLRGYNQAALIAREIATLLSLPCREDILYKEKTSRAQHELNAAERAKNVDSFHIRDIPLDGQRILLCDDVLTTGNTMSRCALLLKQQGASAVIAAAAATTVPRPKRPSPPKEETP
ncbi:MAG: ComF family protein [Oscillospiraceae bacterium]|nr:ComF family protein [Oscillospiraceae bacterium]